MTPEETRERLQIANFFYRGWNVAATSTPQAPAADPRFETVRRLLPGLDPLDKSSLNMGRIFNGFHALDLGILRAERDRRNAGHAAAVDAYTDPANRLTGRRNDYSTTDLGRDVGAGLSSALGGILSGLAPMLPYLAVGVGAWLLLRNTGKG